MLLKRSWKDFAEHYLEQGITFRGTDPVSFKMCPFIDMFLNVNHTSVRSPNEDHIMVRYFEGMPIKEFTVQIEGYLLLARLPQGIAATSFTLSINRGQRKASWYLGHFNRLVNAAAFPAPQQIKMSGKISDFIESIKQCKIVVVQTLVAKTPIVQEHLHFFEDATFVENQSPETALGI